LYHGLDIFVSLISSIRSDFFSKPSDITPWIFAIDNLKHLKEFS